MAENDHEEPDIRIALKRIYEPGSKEDGFRVLVDRLWPRGLKKSEAGVDLWLREIAPSTELRKWFDHDPEKWSEFVSDYNFQLKRNEKVATELLDLIKAHKMVSLLYAAKDEKHNNALVLKHYLDKLI